MIWKIGTILASGVAVITGGFALITSMENQKLRADCEYYKSLSNCWRMINDFQRKLNKGEIPFQKVETNKEEAA